MLPTQISDFGDEARFTPDGRVSVYDGISVILRISEALDNGVTWKTLQRKQFDDRARQQWSRLKKTHPEVVTRCHNFKFPGRRQRETPTADLQTLGEILVLLPGSVAANFRAEAVRTLIRVMNGDPSLADEILARMKASHVSEGFDCIIADPPFYGTIDNPLPDKIPSLVKKGYGWQGNERLMEDWLILLISYRGGYLSRQSPHRSTSLSEKVESRRIDLLVIPFFSSEHDALYVYEFKSNYVDGFDVSDAFYSKDYIDLAIRDFRKIGFTFSKVVGCLVSPAGITDAGVRKLKEIEITLNKRYQSENFTIVLDSLPLHKFVWDKIYPEIASRHEDEEGKFGYGFVNTEVKGLCYKITHPQRFLEAKSRISKHIAERRKNNLAPDDTFLLAGVDELVVDSLLESDPEIS
jgi:hypothetical protein